MAQHLKLFSFLEIFINLDVKQNTNEGLGQMDQSDSILLIRVLIIIIN